MNLSKIASTSLLTTALLLSMNSVQADDDSGFYLGLSVNRANASFNDHRDLDDIDFDDSDNAYGIKGGYMFTDIVGVELAYVDLGEFDTDRRGIARDINLDADGFSAALVLNWSVIDQLDLYGKIGAFRVSANSNSFIGNQLIRADEDATEPFGAFGVEWDLGRLNLFGEVAAIDTEINDLRVDLVSAGVKFEF